MLRYLINLLLASFPPSRWFGLRRFLLRLAGVKMGANARMCGGGWIYGNGIVRIGADSWLSPGCSLYSHPDASIEIGDNCDIGPEVALITGTHNLGPSERRAGQGGAYPIRIGDGCWIGARVTILAGVSIGEGCMVAAGSLVSTSLPANCFAAGVPAKKKKNLV